jgi:hypothetical protein
VFRLGSFFDLLLTPLYNNFSVRIVNRYVQNSYFWLKFEAECLLAVALESINHGQHLLIFGLLAVAEVEVGGAAVV